MYHGVCRLSQDPNDACVSQERLRSHMRYLQLRGLRGVSMQELRLASSRGGARGLVGLTFDDGYDNFLSSALPVLEQFGFSATVFVIGGMMGQQNDWPHFYDPRPQLRLLSASGVREISDRGMEVGSHSMSHARLVGLQPEQLRTEVSESRSILSEIVGREVEGFCYPYGFLDSAAIQAVRSAGYDYACAVVEREGWDDYTLPRIPIFERDGYARFAAKLTIYWQYTALKNMMGLKVDPAT